MRQAINLANLHFTKEDSLIIIFVFMDSTVRATTNTIMVIIIVSKVTN